MKHQRLALDDALDAGLDLSAVGFWQCLGCMQATELKDHGEPHQSCARCGSHRVKWKAPIANAECGMVRGRTGRNAECGRKLPGFELVPPEARPPTSKRLPPEKRDLRKLVQTGYWFCMDCKQVTEVRNAEWSGAGLAGMRNEVTEEEKRLSHEEPLPCSLCGARAAEWQAGVET